MPYRIAETADGYYLLAEVYTPTSTTSPYYSSPYYNPLLLRSPYGLRFVLIDSRGYQPTPYSTSSLRDSEIKAHEMVVMAIDGKGTTALGSQP